MLAKWRRASRSAARKARCRGECRQASPGSGSGEVRVWACASHGCGEQCDANRLRYIVRHARRKMLVVLAEQDICCQRNNRNTAGTIAWLADVPGRRRAVNSRHYHVQEDDIAGAAGRCCNGWCGIVDNCYVMSKRVPKRLNDGLSGQVVFRNEHAQGPSLGVGSLAILVSVRRVASWRRELEPECAAPGRAARHAPVGA